MRALETAADAAPRHLSGVGRIRYPAGYGFRRYPAGPSPRQPPDHRTGHYSRREGRRHSGGRPHPVVRGRDSERALSRLSRLAVETQRGHQPVLRLDGCAFFATSLSYRPLAHASPRCSSRVRISAAAYSPPHSATAATPGSRTRRPSSGETPSTLRPSSGETRSINGAAAADAPAAPTRACRLSADARRSSSVSERRAARLRPALYGAVPPAAVLALDALEEAGP